MGMAMDDVTSYKNVRWWWEREGVMMGDIIQNQQMMKGCRTWEVVRKTLWCIGDV